MNIKATFILVLISFSLNISAQKLSVIEKIPQETAAGITFTIEIEINKYDLAAFAEFKQKLPEGFKATENFSEYANFNYSNNIVSFTWLRMPPDVSVLKVKYDVLIDPKIKSGVYQLPSYLTYQVQNMRGEIKLANPKITVKKYGTSLTDINNKMIQFGEKSTPEKSLCTRSKPKQINNQFLINLTINKGDITGVGKIQENINPGYFAVPDSTFGARFNFSNNIVEFFWDKLPSTNTLEVSYILIPQNSNLKSIPNIKGTFLYVNNDFKIQEVDILQTGLKDKAKNSKKEKNTKENNKNKVKDKEIMEFFNN